MTSLLLDPETSWLVITHNYLDLLKPAILENIGPHDKF